MIRDPSGWILRRYRAAFANCVVEDTSGEICPQKDYEARSAGRGRINRRGGCANRVCPITDPVLLEEETP